MTESLEKKIKFLIEVFGGDCPYIDIKKNIVGITQYFCNSEEECKYQYTKKYLKYTTLCDRKQRLEDYKNQEK